MSDLVNILLLSFAGGILALVGGVIFLAKKSWSDWLSFYSIPFAAGVLLVISIIGLTPEAVHILGEEAFLVVLAAFLAAHFFERFFFGVDNHTGGDQLELHRRASIPIIIFGDTIHNFIDGVAIASAYFVDPVFGVITTLATFLHEVPHEIADFGVLLKAGWGRRKVLLVNILSASTTILGALFITFFMNERLVGNSLAVSAGLFLYLGASNFLPHIHHEEGISRGKAAIAVLVGVLVMFLAIKALPHTHEDKEINIENQKSGLGGSVRLEEIVRVP